MKGNANFSCPFKGLYHLENYNFPMKQLSSTISSSLQKETNSRGHNLFSPSMVPKPPLVNNHNHLTKASHLLSFLFLFSSLSKYFTYIHSNFSLIFKNIYFNYFLFYNLIQFFSMFHLY